MATPMIPLLLPREETNVKVINMEVTPGQPAIQIKMPPKILYHYTSIQTAKPILENHQLKFSTPSSFNDPFDMYEGLIDLTASEKQKKQYITQITSHLSRQQRKELIKSAHKDKTLVERALRSSFIDMRNAAGVCCFSELNDVQLMWSHYANKHNGVVFGFDFQPITNSNGFSLMIREVNYKSKIKSINFHLHKDAAINQWLFTKSDPWAYEKEYRAFIDDTRGYQLFEFSRQCLKEVYFGCRVSEQKIEETMRILEQNKYKDVIIKKMIIDDSTFSVKPVVI